VKQLSAFLLAFTAVMTVTLARSESAMADGLYRHHKHTLHVAYADPDSKYDSTCSLGWWQTLRFGHVRPSWGIRCRSR